MNLIQKIVKKAKEKIDELFLIRKVKSTVESLLVEKEEDIILCEKSMESKLEAGDIYGVITNWRAIQNCKRDMEYLKEFENYVLNNEKNEG